MQGSYKVIVSHEAETMLLRHMAFLAKVSIPAAKKFLASFQDAKEELSAFPLLGPWEDNDSLPAQTYRSYLFYGRYKILYEVEAETVFLDAIVDCRQAPWSVWESS